MALAAALGRARRSGRAPGRLAFVLTLAGCLAAGAVWYRLWDDAVTAGLKPFAGRTVVVEGVLSEEGDAYPGGFRAVLAVDRVWDAGRPWRAAGRVLVLFPDVSGGVAPRYGDRLRVCGPLAPPRPRRNPGEFDYAAYLRHRGIGYVLAVPGREGAGGWERLAGGRGNRLTALALACKRRLAATVEALLPPDRAGLLNGLLFGDKGTVSEEDVEAFRAAGLFHVLSASGLHVGFVAAALAAVARAARLGRVWEVVLVLPAILFYVLMTGAQPPVVRAALMLAALAAARLAGRRGDGLNFLALALLVLLVNRPGAVFEPGFQLSFAATLGLLVLAPPISRWIARESAYPRWRRWLASSLAVSLGAQLATIPPLLAHFGTVSTVGPLANLAAVPVAGAVVPVGFAAALLGQVAEPLGRLAALVTDPLLALLQKTAAWFAAWPGAALSLPRPGFPQVVAYCLALAWLFKLWPFPPPDGQAGRPWLSGAVALLAVAAMVLPLSGGRPWPLEAVFLDVGQGGGVVLRLPGGRVMVVDGGPAPRGRRRGAVADHLRHLGVRRVDVLVMTHFDADHVGGLLPVIRDFPIGEVWESRFPGDDTSVYREIRDAVAARGIPVRRPVRGQVQEVVPGVAVEVLNPRVPPLAGTSADENNNCLVLRIRYGDVSFLLACDLEEEGERDLLADGLEVRSTVLQVGHHGSETSSGRRFLEAVTPRVAVIQVGRNSYGMPGRWTLARLVETGAHLWRTDRSGAVTVRTDGRRLAVDGFLE